MSGIDRFNIADVARIHGITPIRERGGEIYAVCPFCGNEKGKFSYIVKKGEKENLYKCWKCGEAGNAIDLHIKLSNGCEYSGFDGHKKAIRDIFKAINGDSSFEEYHRNSVQKAEELPDMIEKRSDGECSSVYYAMLAELTLNPEHKADLIRRGLSEEDIKRFRFRSVPADSRKVCSLLIKKGYNLEGVPGFFKNKKGHFCMSLSGSKDEDGKWKPDGGYFCPVFDGELNYILGFQIRLDVPKDKTKYLWFSSSGKECGVSSGAIATCLPGEDDSAIIVAEGILKSTIIYCLLDKKVTVIGVPGTKAIKSLECYLERYNGGSSYIFEAYDMDKAIKTGDKKLLEKTTLLNKDKENLINLISDYGFSVHPLKWDMDKEGYWKENYKGLDDFLYAYDGRDKFLAYIKKTAYDTLKMTQYFAKCS